MESKRLMTIKRASQETGASTSFFKQLVREGKLRKYKINSALYISLVEWEQLAQPEQPLPEEDLISSKAKKYDELVAIVDHFYEMDDEGELVNEGDLTDIGEAVASKLGYL